MEALILCLAGHSCFVMEQCPPPKGNSLGPSELLTLNRAVLIVVMFVALVFLLKPALATACTQVFVRILLLALRRLTGILLLILKGLLDEIIYQIEYSLRQSLPPGLDLEHFATAPVQFMSHLLSAITGAAIASIATYMGNRQRMIHIPTVD